VYTGKGGVKVAEVETDSSVLAEALRRVGVEVRRGAAVVAVYGRDRDILRALRTEDRPVLGVSPPGVDAKLAALELRELPLLPELEFKAVDAIRLVAESGGQRVVAINEVALLAAEPAAAGDGTRSTSDGESSSSTTWETAV
jgi:NAD+ kinase